MKSKSARFCIIGIVIGAIMGFLLRPSTAWVPPVDFVNFLVIVTSFGTKARLFSLSIAEKTAYTFYAFLIGGGVVGFVLGYFADLISEKGTK